MRRLSVVALVVSLVIALASISAQSNVGHIRGVVTDESGGPLPGAQVTLSRDGGSSVTRTGS